ncbi:MAG TPA: ferritin-like protein [Anaerolineae bacterium]|nr:ferritin-like protein [Anaerolineae bacterium]
MSYLQVPRMIFSGLFQADVSTVNNDPLHYDTADFRSNYQLPGPGASNGWWNPQGTGAWRFTDCTVKRVYYRDGGWCGQAGVDPVVGVAINGADNRVEGKLVDLDPEQQGVSEVWGFQFLLGNPRQGQGFRADFEVTPFTDMWIRYPEKHSDTRFGAFYQSILTNIGWQEDLFSSRFLQELVGEGAPEKLSIRFNVDRFCDDRLAANFTYGRVVGAIGLYDEAEPRKFVRGRHFFPAAGQKLGRGAALLENQKVYLDLGNSVPTVGEEGALKDLGELSLVILPPKDKLDLENLSIPAGNILGAIQYQAPGWYEETAGIQVITISKEQWKRAKTASLGIVVTDSSGQKRLLWEESAMYARADAFVFRLNCGDVAETTLYATKWGQPLKDKRVKLVLYNDMVVLPPTEGPPAGTPADGLSFPSEVKTDKEGKAILSFKGGSVHNPRGYIDGQVYGVRYIVEGNDSLPGSSSDICNFLVWDDFKAPEEPTWVRDIAPIFQQYANLYPIMKPIVDLGNYGSVSERLMILKTVFDLPMSHPNYMPVTRDLSRGKSEMIRQFLDKPIYWQCETVDDLKQALQLAIELEHATIPPYLTALYSIKPGHNVTVANLIRSVVIEEMLHMSLACNILVAIGGHPVINQPEFLPRYPGSLPAGLSADLTVRLRRCSIEQIRDVFMAIEEPEETLDESRGDVRPGDQDEHHNYTIGWFYTQIAEGLERLSEAGEVTFGHEDEQVAGMIGEHELFKIDSLEKALEAIGEIMEQGEGASVLDPTEGDDELSHYYKFAEIVHGRRIVIKKKGFKYSGEQIPFDSDGVYPMMDDPDMAKLPVDSQAYKLSTQFNEAYLALLNGLHETFNGEPERLTDALGLMYTLDLLARRLMVTPSGRGDGTTAGPSFQWPLGW